jgi:hypothetical protein
MAFYCFSLFSGIIPFGNMFVYTREMLARTWIYCGLLPALVTLIPIKVTLIPIKVTLIPIK